jgi:hypothetical protein
MGFEGDNIIKIASARKKNEKISKYGYWWGMTNIPTVYVGNFTLITIHTRNRS